MKHLLAVLLLCTAWALPAAADGTLPSLLTPEDKARLAQFDANRDANLAEARAKGAPEDVKILEEALAGTPLKTEVDFDATGNWHCRILKLGRGLALTVYPRFRCAISDDGAGWFLKKLTGSQRTEGHFYTDSATRLVYVGTGYVAGEKPPRYGDDPQANQVAYVERLAKDRLVLQFPKPVYDSDFDIMVLER